MFKELFLNESKISVGAYNIEFEKGEPGEKGFFMVYGNTTFLGSIDAGIGEAGVWDDIMDLTGEKVKLFKDNKSLVSLIKKRTK